MLDILVSLGVTPRPVTRFFRKLLRGLRYVPSVLLTDKLASCGVARRRADARCGASPLDVSEQQALLPYMWVVGVWFSPQRLMGGETRWSRIDAGQPFGQ